MKSTIKLNILKVNQPISEIVVAKISPQVLLEMSAIDRRRIENDEELLGVQRQLKLEKVAQIKSYLSSIDATFPNSIIVNTTSEFIKSISDNEIELEVNENTFTIIDGQHRLEGFRDNNHDNFELILAIFRDLTIPQQANIFSTINSEQTKVDPSLNLNLELNSNELTPKKMMIQIAQSLNYDKESPWHNNIRMLGSQSPGIISLASFVKPLLELTYPENEYYKIRNELMQNKEFPKFERYNYKIDRYLFWEFYKRQDFDSIYKILYNYFNAVKNVFDKDWLNSESLLNKTTGYNAFMKLFKDLAKEGIETNDLSQSYFSTKISKLSDLNGKINSQNYGASGTQASNRLYEELKSKISKASS